MVLPVVMCFYPTLRFLTSQRHPNALLFSPGLPAPLWPHIPPRLHDYTLELSFTITLNLCPLAWNNHHFRSTPAMCLLCSVTIAENSTMGQTGITNLWFPDILCRLLDDPFTHFWSAPSPSLLSYCSNVYHFPHPHPCYGSLISSFLNI